MNDYKNILGMVTVALQIGSFGMYFWTIYKGQTKPHGFTWFVWGTINAVGFAAVESADGGSGAWVIAGNVIACYTVAGIAFWQKRILYDLFDWLALAGAFLAMFLWWLTSDPLYAVLLVSLSDATGAIPTIRKAYHLPYEENPHSFLFGLSYYIIALFALETFSLTTSFYHFAIIFVDAIIIFVIYARRNKLKQIIIKKTAD